MDRASLLELVELLGKEFERRDMRTHLESLRLYYVAIQKRLDHRGTVRIAWTEEMTVDWLAMLRLPPYEAHYPVRSREYHCPCTPPAQSTLAGDYSQMSRSNSAVETVFPGGYKVRCNGCDKRWLVLDEPASASTPPGATPSS
jgi:hypothetical protein